jgi:hypothetical protein
VTIVLFWASNTHFYIGRHKNKEKCLCCFGFRILLPIQIQLLEIEKPNKNRIPQLYIIYIFTYAAHKLKPQRQSGETPPSLARSKIRLDDTEFTAATPGTSIVHSSQWRALLNDSTFLLISGNVRPLNP